MNRKIQAMLQQREAAIQAGNFDLWSKLDKKLGGDTCNSCGEFRMPEQLTDKGRYLGFDSYCTNAAKCGLKYEEIAR